VQLRGVNYSGYEFTAVNQFDPSDPSGAQAGQANGPNLTAINAWKANVLRIPLNEASWLGYTCIDTSGNVLNPDPGSNYQSAVEAQVAAANAAGLYVILDLHWAAPTGGGAYPVCPMEQAQAADSDHSLTFWTSIANQFKSNPAVMFELFNEPFLADFTATSGNQWTYLMQGTGGEFTAYLATSLSNNQQTVTWTWQIASYQAMINAVRATGATNVVLVGSNNYTSDLSGWLANRPTDPQTQMAATWHAYPTSGQNWQNPCTGSNTYCTPNYSSEVYGYVQNILSAGIPVLITETGDQNTSGTVGSPLVETVTSFADAPGTASTSSEPGATWSSVPGLPPIGVIGWAWDTWSNSDDVLITSASGGPTSGYGQYYQSWLVNHK
jgi:endoglucanase